MSATSDGVLVDVTAPSPGVVQDGTFSEDIEYQSLRYALRLPYLRRYAKIVIDNSMLLDVVLKFYILLSNIRWSA